MACWPFEVLRDQLGASIVTGSDGGIELLRAMITKVTKPSVVEGKSGQG